MLLLPMTALRPGNSSGLMPLRPSHQKVLLRPSNDTVARVSSTNSTPLGGKGGRSASARPGMSEGQPLPSSACSGATRAISPKNTENASPRASHACSPNSAMPIQVTTL